MATDTTYTIVGASLAGAKAAEALRTEGFDGRVVLIGEERERPYERPPLSKDYLQGKSERDTIYVHPPALVRRAQRRAAARRRGLTGIDRAGHEVGAGRRRAASATPSCC